MNMKIKKYILTLLISSLIFIAACGNGTVSKKAIPLSAEESELLEIIGNDLEIIVEKDYAHTVSEIIAHTNQFTGKVVQLEGAYSDNDNNPIVYRILINEGEETICGLPLVFLEKELPDDSWIRVSGIVNESKSGAAVLEVIAVEALPVSGNKTLKWNGMTHQH